MRNLLLKRKKHVYVSSFAPVALGIFFPVQISLISSCFAFTTSNSLPRFSFAMLLASIYLLKDIISTLAAGVETRSLLPSHHSNSANHLQTTYPLMPFWLSPPNPCHGLWNGATWVDLPSLVDAMFAAAIHLKWEHSFLVIESSSEDFVSPNESINLRPIEWTTMQCGCSRTTTSQLQSSLSLSTGVIMIFVRVWADLPRKEFAVCAAKWLFGWLLRQHNIDHIWDSTLLHVKQFPRGRYLKRKVNT